jgi:hypothetical protein
MGLVNRRTSVMFRRNSGKQMRKNIQLTLHDVFSKGTALCGTERWTMGQILWSVKLERIVINAMDISKLSMQNNEEIQS